MTAVNFSVKGLSELEAALDALPDKMARRIYGKSLKTGMKPIADSVREILFGQVKEHTGDLLNSLRVNMRSAQGGGATIQQAVLTVGSKKAFYAYWIEHGTMMHQITSNKGMLKIGATGQYRHMVEVGGITPRPFMRPGFDQQKENAVELFAEDLRGWIEGAQEDS
jgi:HK97 gp10 family phage protein